MENYVTFNRSPKRPPRPPKRVNLSNYSLEYDGFHRNVGASSEFVTRFRLSVSN